MESLRLERLTKTFGAVRAVHDVSVAFEAGAIHAVVGENGAGKSTLLKMAAGLVTPDAGRVLVEGTPLAPLSAKEAIRRGVGMVQQHFALVGVFNALENVALGSEGKLLSFGRVDLGAARAKLAKVLEELGVTLDVDRPVQELGVGDRQRLEIARALYRDASVLILDEPTAVLTPAEADTLFLALRRLATAGRAVLVVTHKLDEVMAHADAVTVLRRGERVSTHPVTEVTAAKLAEDIMGEGAAVDPFSKAQHAGDGEALALVDVRVGRALRGLSLAVRAGEVVGVAGVEGNGQRELVRVIAGLLTPDAGELRLAGRVTSPAALGRAVAVVHEDRHAEGLVLDASVRENLVLGEHARFARFGVLDAGALERAARHRLEAGGVRPPDLDAPARALSGGNQQKIVVERAVARTEGETGARVLVLSHPTRGVDLGAARSIHAAILAAAARGVAVLVLSSDLSELRALADRLLVLARGAVVRELPSTASDRELGAAMLSEASA